MSIRIKNLSNGRTIIVKNQDDMFDLVNHTKDPNYEPLQDDPATEPDPYPDTGQTSFNNWQDALRSRNNGYNADDKSNLDSPDDTEKDDYIKMFSQSQADSDKADQENDLLQQHQVDSSEPAPDGDMPQSDEFSLDDDSDPSEDSEQAPEGDKFSLDDTNADGDTDKDFAGLIRTVRGACLVYKRANEEGSFDELWIYNIGDNLKKETEIRRAIISGTDINPETQASDDGEQKARTYTIGNVQFLHLLNIPQ